MNVKDFFWPSFPQQYVLLVSDDKISSITEKELETIHSFRNKMLLRNKESGEEFFVIGASSVYSLSTTERPLTLFKESFLLWFAVWYGVVYTMFTLPVFFEELFWLYSAWWYMSIITSLAWYVGLTVYRFTLPSVRYFAAMLVWTYAGAPVYAPYPYPYSTLSVKKLLEILDRHYAEVMVNRASEAELKAALTVLKTETATQAKELAEHKAAFENAATIVRQRLLKTSDWLQDIQIQAMQRKMLLFAAGAGVFALILGLVLGYVLSGGGVMIAGA